MRKVDPTIKLIAGGAMPDVMEGADQARRINGQYVPDYLSPADWTGQMLLHCLDNIDMVSEHYYASGTQHTDMKLQKKVPIDPPLSLIEWERAPADAGPREVRALSGVPEAHSRALRAKPVPIAIDEWAYYGGAPATPTRWFRPMPGPSTRCSATRISFNSAHSPSPRR